MIYPIVIYGHPVLKRVAPDISKEEYPHIKQIVNDMFDTMEVSHGVGLAAPQIGLSARIFVVNGNPLKEDYPEMENFRKVFINAHITEYWGEEEIIEEGCLSIPGMHEDVSRKSNIRIEYLDEDWNFHTDVFSGYTARVIQHEYDHLDGILYVDRVSQLRKRLIKGKLNGIIKGNFDADYKTILSGQKLKTIEK